SIKRVEILSAMRERAPNLPEVKPAELATLRTLGQIVERMRGAAVAAAPVAAAPVAAAPAAPAPAATALDLEALMMIIVAEKTGYPKEMLGAHMELEADLGIDSIKRVEILSAMRERAPNLPEVKPAELATLRTLGQIVERMRTTGTPAAAPVTTATVAAAHKAETPQANVERFAVREVPASPVGMALSGILGAQHLVVTDDGAGVAAALVSILAKQGVKATVVSTLDLMALDLTALANADAVIFLGGLRAVSTVDEAIAINREAFRASRAVAERFGKNGGAFVTVQDTGGDFGLSGRDGIRAYLGGISALARTAALEWPVAAVKAIDIQRGQRDANAVADAIAGELLNGGTTLEVGLHADGRRTTLASVATPPPVASAENINASSVIVASGGGRGVTAACLLALAKARHPAIVLLGRTRLGEEPAEFNGIGDEAGLKQALLRRAQAEGRKPTPAQLNGELAALLAQREIRATLSALQAAGSRARYLAVDVADAAALDAALDTVRRDFGPVTAIVHGAGVLADKRIAEKTDAQFDYVFDTKISGLRALLAATAKDPLDTLCLFSSIAARTGNLGQCDYAMANEVLNLVACAERARRGPSCVVRSIGWGPWEGGMVTPSLKAHFQQMGVALIPLEAGAQRFVEEMLGGGEDIQVVIGGARVDGALGAGALGAAPEPRATVEVHVDQRSHPYLADHRINGVEVVPMVLAVEWFMRAAHACCPNLVLAAVQQVKVLRGIKLKGYAERGDRFVVGARLISSATGKMIAVELRGEGNVLHYSATVKMAEHATLPPQVGAQPALEKWTQEKVYDGH
ncbi:MAG: SDR family oxidoreductase, partial [Gammaproteobacteria bacterium]|nr:SDR family oxidoreductase [Gammaproteobacteria bacterium]